MEELKTLAEKVRSSLKLKYDANSVQFIEGFIERNKLEFEEADWPGLINSCGAFLGQCIIENYGGSWAQEEDGQITVAFDERNKVFPFATVSKQFANGLEDSIFSFYTVIPIVFKLAPKPRKKWWQF
ncbi:hypothetical protein GCM10023185_34490 [Hymenobacter saemangeumensis]|uniref:DUF3806 domain-containing protein n=1 Tax=Hymenobacter saemangeumensis TaxID=1084522 RepID=A0ABP8INY9_9BACT